MQNHQAKPDPALQDNSIHSTSSELMLSKVEASKFKILLTLISLFIIHYSLFVREAFAHCPLCVGGAVIGLSLARFLGVDDAITGVWFAALLGAFSFWLDSYLAVRVKKIKKGILSPLTYILIFGSTIASFYLLNDYAISNLKFYLINAHAGQIFGVDKLTFGILSGAVTFYLIDKIDDFIIKKKGKVYFPYQRIIVSLGGMVLLSIAIFILINYYI